MLIKYTVPSDKSGMQNILCILLQLGKNEHTRQTGRIKSRMVIRILEGRKRLSDFFQKNQPVEKDTCQHCIPPLNPVSPTLQPVVLESSGIEGILLPQAGPPQTLSTHQGELTEQVWSALRERHLWGWGWGPGVARLHSRQSANPAPQSSSTVYSEQPVLAAVDTAEGKPRNSAVETRAPLARPGQRPLRMPLACVDNTWPLVGMLPPGTDSKASWNLKKFRNSWIILSIEAEYLALSSVEIKC